MSTKNLEPGLILNRSPGSCVRINGQRLKSLLFFRNQELMTNPLSIACYSGSRRIQVLRT